MFSFALVSPKLDLSSQSGESSVIVCFFSGGDQMDPLQLLERCDVTSYPGFHSEPRPLPPVREPTFQLGKRFSTDLWMSRWRVTHIHTYWIADL